ncbi:hypothetical protein SNE40_010090 [Patella caerulea]|uniref:Uncharacterized protein n=1 Tax=Patella caerulea TaxID=87958 RepID=A0AAN8JQW7_PATCE
METPIIPQQPAPNVFHDYIAGALGGTSGLIVGHPFDTTKIQLQIQHKGRGYRGTNDALRQIHTKHGWTKGFLRGLAWPMLSYGAVNSIFFGVYGSSLRVFQRLLGNEGSKPGYLSIYMSGCVAGAAQLGLACPVDLIKVILQSQISNETKNSGSQTQNRRYFTTPYQCARDVVKQHGIRGLYKGLVIMSYRDIPSYGLYCLTFEYLEHLMHKYTLTDKNGITANLFAGGMAGTVCWFSIMPMDVVKSRLQADLDNVYKGLIDCARKTVREDGFRALYKGTIITCIRAFPVNAATFLVYSQSLKYLNSR